MSIAHAMNSEPPMTNGTATQANVINVGSKPNNGKNALLDMVKTGENNSMGRVFLPMKCSTVLIRMGINR